MAQHVFGTRGQIEFGSDAAFFYALGFLANGRRSEFVWENNEEQGAWGSEGRIHCRTEPDVWPAELRSAFTAGRSGIIHRINCNEYVAYLRDNHCIELGREQNIAAIRATVPTHLGGDFQRGLDA